MATPLISLHGHLIGLTKNNELTLRNPSTGSQDIVAINPVVGAGAKNGTGITVEEFGGVVARRSKFTFVNHAIALTDEAGVVAYAGQKIYDMPAGVINILGATANLALTKSSAGVNLDWDGDFGLGSVTASNNATLATTEQNIIPTTATPQAVAGATTAKGGATSSLILDGSTTAVDIFLNFLVDDTDHNVSGTACNLIVNGELNLYWINLGDF